MADQDIDELSESVQGLSIHKPPREYVYIAREDNNSGRFKVSYTRGDPSRHRQKLNTRNQRQLMIETDSMKSTKVQNPRRKHAFCVLLYARQVAGVMSRLHAPRSKC